MHSARRTAGHAGAACPASRSRTRSGITQSVPIEQRTDRRDPLIACRIPPSLNTRLRDYCTASSTTISEVVRVALEARLGAPEALTPHSQRAPRTAPACEHRVKRGSYCRRCERVIP